MLIENTDPLLGERLTEMAPRSYSDRAIERA